MAAGLQAPEAKAIGLLGTQTLPAAIDGLAEPVHCRPGRWHHQARPHDGCYRRYRYIQPQYYDYEPGFYGYGPGFYGPGVSFQFGFGGHRRHHGWRW